MYYDYFNLKQPPFRITPDTSLFFPGGDRGAILDALIYAIVSGEGIVKLVGEVGSGKTTLCRMLEKELPANVEIVYLANPSLSPDNILHAIAFELGIKVQPDSSRLKVMNDLQNYLLERHAENKQVVVFVEEAQSMPIATLEEIRLLSNLETAQNKLLQIVIFGQPELDVMIARQEIRQLKERITYSFYLNPLKPEEIKDYINSRLRACGYRSTELFNEKAIKCIAKYSNGLLRRINILADKSLLACYAANVNCVTAKHVELAASETEFVSDRKTRNISFNRPVFLYSLLAISLASIVLFALLNLDLFSVDKQTEQLKKENLAVLHTDVEDDNSALMLIEQNEEDVVLTNEKMSASIVKSEVTDSATSIEETLAVESQLLPDPSELESAAWQSMEQYVYTYPETPLKQENVVNEISGDMMNIDSIKNTPAYSSQNRELLMQQLVELPSETIMTHNSLATGMTCKLCSTFIYRPVKETQESIN